MFTKGGKLQISIIFFIFLLMVHCGGGAKPAGNDTPEANPKVPAIPVNPDGGANGEPDGENGGAGAVGEEPPVADELPGQLGTPCANSNDCSENEYCHAARGCQAKCSETADCSERETCQDGACVAWAIDRIPGLREKIVHDNSIEGITERINEAVDRSKVGGISANNQCWNNYDCKVTQICSGADRPLGGTCIDDPVIGDVCDGNAGDAGFNADRMRSCPAGYHCNYNRQTRLGHCEKRVSCPADRVLRDEKCVLRCEENFRWNGSVCAPANQAACEDNETFHQGECRSCPQGQFFEDGRCYNSCRPPQVWNGQSNQCEDIEAADVAVDMLPQATVQSIKIVVDTTTKGLPAGHRPHLEFKFCPYFEVDGDIDYNAIYRDGACFTRKIVLNTGAVPAGRVFTSHVTNELTFAGSNYPLSRFYYFSATFFPGVVPAANANNFGANNNQQAAPVLNLHGMKITAEMSDGSNQVIYLNPCIQRLFTGVQRAVFSLNDTALCVRMATANVEDAESPDAIKARVFFDSPVVAGGETPGVSYQRDGRMLEVGLINEDESILGMVNYHYRDSIYADYFTLFDTKGGVANGFQLIKDGDNGLAIRDLRVIAFKPGQISNGNSALRGECSMFSADRRMPGGFTEAGIHLYWMDTEVGYLDDNGDSHNLLNIFPASGTQPLNIVNNACNQKVVDLSSRLNQ